MKMFEVEVHYIRLKCSNDVDSGNNWVCVTERFSLCFIPFLKLMLQCEEVAMQQQAVITAQCYLQCMVEDE